MADLTIAAADVKLVRGGDEHQHTAPAGETFNAGQYIRLDPTTGKFHKGNATSAAEVGDGFFALNSAVAVGDPVTGLKAPCVVDVGDALSGLNFAASVFVSDTDATFADAAGTVSTVAGKVIPGWAATTAKKLLRIAL